MRIVKLFKGLMSMTKQQVTAAPTMYDLSFEKDACGMGFIAQMEGTELHIN